MTEKRFTYGETIDYNFFDVFEKKKYLGMIQRDSTKIIDRLNELVEENEQLKETNEKLQWELVKTREDLDYFANLKVSAIRGSDCGHDRCYVTSMQKKGD